MRVAIAFLQLLFTTSICGSEKSDPNEVRQAVSKALVLLEHGSAGSAKQRKCFTCHSQAMPVLAFAEARRRGLYVNEENFTAQLEHTARFLKRSKANFDNGKGVGGQVDTAGFVLWTLEDGDVPAGDETDSVVTWLLGRQTEQGHWKTSSKRPPSESSNFTATYLALRGIEVFGSAEQQPKVEQACASAAKWLHDAEPKDTEDRVFQVLSLNRLDDSADRTGPIINQLKQQQRADGGWSQTDDMESDAYATGTVLYTLHHVGISSDQAVYRRGVQYLLNSQLDDGSWHVVSRSKPLVLTTDKPWEGNTSAYFTMFEDVAADGTPLFRMYYRGSHYNETIKKATHPEVTCYAESKDGVNWSKPELNLYEFDGSKKNNIVWNGPGTHCFTPFKDGNPLCEPDARYKAISRGRPSHPAGLYAFKSPDAIHWSLISDKPIITEGAFDSQNLAFWDQHDHCYRAYHRNFRNGVRGIMMETSGDFLTWTKPEYIRLPDSPNEHLYTNAIRRYFRAPRLLLGFSSAAAILIVASQFELIFGLPATNESAPCGSSRSA